MVWLDVWESNRPIFLNRAEILRQTLTLTCWHCLQCYNFQKVSFFNLMAIFHNMSTLFMDFWIQNSPSSRKVKVLSSHGQYNSRIRYHWTFTCGVKWGKMCTIYVPMKLIILKRESEILYTMLYKTSLMVCGVNWNTVLVCRTKQMEQTWTPLKIYLT